MRKSLAGEAHERGAIVMGCDIALEDLAAGFVAKLLGGIATSAVGADDVVRLGEFNRDRAADSAARSGHDASGFRQP